MKIATDGSERMTFTDPKPISLFIADDHMLYVDSLVIALQQQTIFPVRVLGTASNGAELLTRLKSSMPDILLLDLNMPVMNGLEVIPLLKSEYPKLRIVIVTKYNDTKFVRECLQIHNVAGYILKTSALSEMLDGLAQVAKGHLFMSKSIQLYPKDGTEESEVTLLKNLFLQNIILPGVSSKF